MASVSDIPVDTSGNPLSGSDLTEWLARTIQESRRSAGLGNENVDSQGRPLGPGGAPLTGDALTYWLIRQWTQSREAVANSNNISTPAPKVTAKDIGYFYPRYIKHGESKPTTDFMVDVGETVHYTSVSAFLDRIQDMIVPYGPNVIKQQLVQCLKGEAATWYSQELDATEKMTIRDDTSTNLVQFSTKLKKRFRINRSEALDHFYGSIYSPRDAQAGRHLRDFISVKHLQGREADFSSDQLPLMIHNMIDPSYQLAMMEVTERTTFQEYREHCATKGDLFIKAARGKLAADSPFSSRLGFGSSMRMPMNSAPLPTVRGDSFRNYSYQANRNATGSQPRSMASGQTMGPDGKMYANPQNLSRPCRHCASSGKIAYHKDPECPRLTSWGGGVNKTIASNWSNNPMWAHGQFE